MRPSLSLTDIPLHDLVTVVALLMSRRHRILRQALRCPVFQPNAVTTALDRLRH